MPFLGAPLRVDRWRGFCWVVCGLALPTLALAADAPLKLSVYATAGGVNRYLNTADGRERAVGALRHLGISKVFLEGRRGDAYVSPDTLRVVRDFFVERGVQVSGGIATVPGASFGVRQNERLGWLNYEAEKTQRDMAQFFAENAAVFDELIIDDFYCTADTSPESQKARGGRSWGQYRQDLLVSLLERMIVQPARGARPTVRLIQKYPQWYDRFQMFGYDPARMPAAFDRIWVGTEVRNPKTRRMGFVQPTEGYFNYRWLAAAVGPKVQGAWFDHIESTPQNFLDQAYQSVLAGARELTLFNLGDVIEGHGGHELLVAAWPELVDLAGKVKGRSPKGIAYYKPPGSDGDENLYLMDYLGMIGLPIVPAARYPGEARVAILGVQAAGDPQLLDRVRRHVARGATLVFTPALVRRLGSGAAEMAGVGVSGEAQPGAASEVEFGGRRLTLDTPLEVDLGLTSAAAAVRVTASTSGRRVPLVTAHAQGAGRVLVWNVRTFSEQDFLEGSERLLAPKPLGLPEMPRALVDELRTALLEPLGIRLAGPTQVGFYLLGDAQCFYNFLDRPVDIALNGKRLSLGPNQLVWQQGVKTAGAISIEAAP